MYRSVLPILSPEMDHQEDHGSFLVVVWTASFSPLYGVTGSAGRIVTMPGCKLAVFRSTSILLLLYSVCIPVLLTTITLYGLIVKAAMNLLTYTCFSTCHHFHRSPTEECTNTALDWFPRPELTSKLTGPALCSHYPQCTTRMTLFLPR